MSDNVPRRGFISRLGLGISAIIAAPIIGITRSVKNELDKKSTTMKEENPVLYIRPMGFQWETADPFLFCVHHEDKFPKGNDQLGPVASMEGRHMGDDFIIKDGFRMYHGKKVPGFPGHPHRGFETVTVVREGLVDHADSLGAAGRYGNGDVQWMTAGGGVQHSEMFPLLSKDKDNPLELFQIWLNLPKKNKMVKPYFRMLWSDTIPRYTHKDEAGKETEVEVIAGGLHGKNAPAPPPDSWASDPENDVAIWNIKMDAGATWVLPKAKAGINRTIYFYQGDSLIVQDENISSYNGVGLIPDRDINITNGATESKILVLQGKPINEPVMQYGPFVMNTKEEINQAFEDYHRTQFGGWPWPRPDQVHDRNLGRFALHADGTKEVKS